MVMNKNILLLILFVGFNHLCFGQIIKIKKELKEMLFELSIPSTKYDVRKKLHSSTDFTELSEYPNGNYDVLNAEFKSNYKLSYLQNSVRRLASFWFNKGTDINFSFGFEIHYPSQNVTTCSQQFEEMMNFFKPISYKTTLDPYIVDSVQRGEWFSAYSSLKSYQNNEPYLLIMTQYTKVDNNITSPPPGEYYEVSFSFYHKYLY